MKLLILGSGFIGHSLAGRLEGLGHEVTVSPRGAFDITNRDSIIANILKVEPEAVINAAGNKNVVWCEKNPKEAQQVNGLGVLNFASACSSLDILPVHISTDLVYQCTDGDYVETEETAPRTIYGRSKQMGDEFMEDFGGGIVCRTGGVYGPDSPWLEGLLEAVGEVSAFTDVHNTPTYIGDLARGLSLLLEKKARGVFHVAGGDRVSRFTLYETVSDVLGGALEIVPAEAPPHLLLQPDSSLNIDKMLALGYQPTALMDGLKRSILH